VVVKKIYLKKGKNMFVDTHCHLMMIDQESGEEKVIKEARESGVGHLITIGTTLEDSIRSVELAKKYTVVSATIGMHPCDCGDDWKNEFDQLKKLLKNNLGEKIGKKIIVGIGETGLDFYHKPFFKQRQIDSFCAHIELAIEYRLPIVLHIRDSAEEALKVLEKYKDEIRGVAHCFVQKEDIAKILLDWGFYLGIGGPISYPKNKLLRNMFASIDLERILLETDAPFLPPQQYRGQRNHPKYIPLIAQVLAEVKQVDVKTVESVTTENANNLFKLTPGFVNANTPVRPE
jgi:TatD DNase family protein